MRTWRISKEAARLATEPNALALARQQIDGALAIQDLDGVQYWTDVWCRIQELAVRNGTSARKLAWPSAAVQVRLILRLLNGLSGFDRPTAIAMTGLGLSLVMLIDWSTGAQCNLLLAYLVVVGFASWTLSDRAGAVVAGLATAAVGGMLHIQHQGLPSGYTMPGTTEAWNLFVHFASLLLFAGVVGALREVLDRGNIHASLR